MADEVDGLRMVSGGETADPIAVAVAPGAAINDRYSHWGEMPLHEAHYDAIAKFREANLKGPQSADPLEMWGEAPIEKSRSDLALAKFAGANKYAPNWGRLHLKWGKALLWSGDNSGARRQFAAAAALDLSPSDRSRVARLPRS